MRFLFFLATAALLAAQTDPAMDAYRAWEASQSGVDSQIRTLRLLDASADWVAKWPDSTFAWNQRRSALISIRSKSAELWKQVEENLMRLGPAHPAAWTAAMDWVAAEVNLEDAEKLLLNEMAWTQSRSRPAPKANPTLTDLLDEATFTTGWFAMADSLARAQILLKQFDAARETIDRIKSWLDGDFRTHYDQDPLEAFPDYQAKYFDLSARLAAAEGRKADALAFYHAYLANPYYHREYGSPGPMNSVRPLWNELGGSESGWTAFSTVPPLPAGTPVGQRGSRFPAWANVVYYPWVKVEYQLPPMQLADLNGRTWTNQDFQGKTTIVYLWSARCPSCSPALNVVQALAGRLQSRPDVQILTLNVDQDLDKLAEFMKTKSYTFPVLPGRPYVQTVLPQFLIGQFWIVDGSGKVRLQRQQSGILSGVEEAYVQELLYKARQFEQ